MSQKRLSRITNRLKNSLLALLFVGTQVVFPLAAGGVASALNGAADIDQCANGKITTPATCGTGWQNGDLNSNDSHYREGDTVPFRVKFSNLSTSGTHTFTLSWQTTKDGKHAYDYLKSFDATEGATTPCDNISGCDTPATFAIPTDSNVTGAGVTPAAGNFTMYNGVITHASAYTLSGTYAGTSTTSITLTFTASKSTPVLAWGGHVASQDDWGPGNSASAISGSPYHMATVNLDSTSSGSQDRAIQASAILPTPGLTTQVSSSTVTVGNTVTDTATLTGPSNPLTGTVKFFVCGPNASTNPDCTTGGTQVGGTATVSVVTAASGNQSATSTATTTSAYQVSADGDYCFRAEYTPASDAPYSPFNHTNLTTECFTAAFAPPALTVVKKVVNDNGGTAKASDFNVKVNDTTLTGGTLSNSDKTDTYVFSNPESGTPYTVGESDPTTSGYSQTSLVCTDDSTGATVTNPVTLGHGQDVTCTITNDDIAPTLTLVKHANGGTAIATDWTLSANGPTPISGTSGSSAVTNATVNAGQYTLAESNGPSGYTPSAWVCDHGSLSGSTLTLPLDTNATCTITNTRDTGTVTVNKTLLPSNDTGRFNLSINGTDNFTHTATNQGDNGTTGQQTVDTGTYTVSETGYGGTSLSDYLSTYQCTDGEATVASGNGTSVSNLSVSKNHNIICTFTNTREASISGTKYLVDADGTHEGTITGWTIYLLTSGSQNPLSTQTGADGSFSFTGLDPSLSYTLYEDTSNTAYTQITSDSQGSTCTQTTYLITLLAGESSQNNDFCNFQNASISGFKFNDVNGNGSWDQNEAGLKDWTIFIDSNNNGHLDNGEASTTTDKDGQYTFTNLAPGTYTICEDVNSQTGYVQTYPTTNGGCHTVTITLSGVTYTQDDSDNSTDFGNQGRGHIIVDKVTDPSGDPQSFDFTTTGTGYDGFSLTDAAAPNDQEVAAGSYTVAETPMTGWDLTDSTCDNHQSPDDITVGPGQTITCTFTNTKRGSITIVKDVEPANAKSSSPAFTFDGNLGQFNLTDDGTNDKLNSTTFDNLTPDTYSVTEPANLNHEGWTLTDIQCSTEQDLNVNNREVNIHLQPGQNITCTFTNTRDTGTVTVDKIINPSTDTGLFNLSINGETNFTANDQPNGGTTGSQAVNTGSYTVSETAGTDTNMNDYVSSYSCSNDVSGNGTKTPSFDVNKDDDITCTFTNNRKATIIVTKYNDLDHSGTFDPTNDTLGLNEPALPGWDMTLAGLESQYLATQPTGNDGTTTFTDITPDQAFTLDETLQSDWNRSFAPESDSNIYCIYPGERVGFVSEGRYIVEPGPGDVINCYVGNFRTPVLDITKANNRPDPTTTGDTVTYTLTVTDPVESGTVYNTTVTDLPPKNFTFIKGSWTAHSSVSAHDATIHDEVVNGSLDDGGDGNPTYGSPGTWHIGTLLPGEVVTLTYQTLIGNTVSPGTYPDLAFTAGFTLPDSGGARILGNLNFTDTPFVGTQVTVKQIPQVLGTSIELVNTGTSLLAAQFILPVLLIGAMYITRRASAEKGGRS